MTNTWVTQVRNDQGQWVTQHSGTQFSAAIKAHNDTPEPKRFLRNGRVLRLGTDPSELDLFNEENDNP